MSAGNSAVCMGLSLLLAPIILRELIFCPRFYSLSHTFLTAIFATIIQLILHNDVYCLHLCNCPFILRCVKISVG